MLPRSTGPNRIAGVITRLAAGIAVTLTFLLPAGYFALSLLYEQGGMQTQAQVTALLITQFIDRNPELWRFEEHGLHTVLEQYRSTGPSLPEQRRIVDLDGRIIRQSKDEIAAPVITRSAQLFDFGTPVGRVEVSRSVRPLLIRTGGAAVIGVILGIAVFITLRVLPLRDLERALDALRLRNRALDSSVNAIIITNCTKPDDPIEYVNPAFERITGYLAAEVLGRNPRFMFRDDRDQPGLETIRRAIREKREACAIVRNYRKDGSLFWSELHIAPVRDETGKITHFVGVQNDITELKRYEEQLEHQATHDALTGLPNRVLMMDRLRQEIAHASRYGHKIAVLFIDLDHFKLVNDSLGHSAGDRLLKSGADRLKSCVRGSDTLARYGGDEFVLVLHDTARGEIILEIIQRIQGRMAEPFFIEGREFYVTCSIGVSVYPQDGEDVETLLKNADAAMYRSKELGRNNFQFFTAEMHEKLSLRVLLEGKLHRARERGEFLLYYQPKVDLHSRLIVGIEALIRWNDPEAGIVPPSRFIPILEETGMILEVGLWALGQAVSDYRYWREQGLNPPRIAVNVSQIQLRHRDFVDMVRNVVMSAPEGREALDLEITESLIMEDVEESMRKLRAIREMGLGIAIDDFGTGYSSLSYIARLPVSALKIDRAFITQMTDKPDDFAVVSTIVSLAHGLHLKVVAEGVETEAQAELLKIVKCDEIQGYLVSPPVPREKIERLLTELSPREIRGHRK